MTDLSGKIDKLAIANRGEVAVRIIRACHELGIQTVLLHSEVDESSRAYRLSDETVCIGLAPASESYLNIEANVNGALAAGAQAVHPGFGFLSENADFARRCAEEGLIFVGPSPEAITLLGDKIQAKALVEKADVPTVPGYQGEDQCMDRLVKESEAIGYPVIAKAAAGGGGRGMKVIRSREEAENQIESAQREAKNAFGSSTVFLEKYLDRAKHIEVQVFVDAASKTHALFERECSVQRRHQKIVEEALSPSLSKKLREEMMACACRVAEAAKYKGAGTVEFLLQDDEFYFLEMNTRLQVEHPVTEMVVGVDLVKAQILTAAGQVPSWPVELTAHGHAIECRVYAEDAYNGGIPSTGKLGTCIWPEGPGRRFEVGFAKGDEVTAFYDSMIAKVIVWDETRERAIQKALRVLDEAVIFGLKTNIPYLKAILSHPDFVAGTMTTKFVEQYFAEGIAAQTIPEEIESFAQKILAQQGRKKTLDAERTVESPWSYHWGAR